MKKISESVVKKDHHSKVNGAAKYIADLPLEGLLFAKLVRSPHARARVLSVRLPDLPSGYFAVEQSDVPGENRVPLGLADIPVFAGDMVEYIGDPVLMIVGPDEKEVDRLVRATEIDYAELAPILDMQASDTVFYEYQYSKGDIAPAFADADLVYEETFRTGQQEHAALETQGIIAEYKDGRLFIRGSMQCPYYVLNAVAQVMDMPPENIRVRQDVTGGGFGSKEDFPSIVACQAAIAAKKAGGRPVRFIYDRREDMEFTPKRHPSACRYKIAVKGGRISAMDVDIVYDGGAYSTLSSVVLQRGIIAASGVYTVDNLFVHGRAVKANTTPNGAFRGFGGPQPFVSVEMVMSHLAKKLGEEPLAFKERHVAKKGDLTSTSGKYHFTVPIPAMIEAVDGMSGYREKRREYAKPQGGRYRKGIGLSLWFHGAGFTGSGERDLIKAVAGLRKYPDGRVEVLAANTDMGQGIKTTFAKIVAKELGIPMEQVIVNDPDTDLVPDSGPTVASRSLMVVGELLRRCALRLRAQWKDGETQEVEERFQQPEYQIPFDLSRFRGDAYPTYAWGVCAVELQVDTLTGMQDILGAWGSFDVGTPIDENIVTGQMEGGLMQGLGYASMEQMRADGRGRIRNNSYSDYIIPAALDVPLMQVHLHVEEYPEGPYGAKGAGELPTVGPAAAYIEAAEQALASGDIHHIPFSMEDALDGVEVRK